MKTYKKDYVKVSLRESFEDTSLKDWSDVVTAKECSPQKI